MQQPPSFVKKIKRAAEWIREGGLKDEDDVSQVKKESYEWLARLNELGLLTVDSQDGQTRERAYVSGYMPIADAYTVIDAFDCYTDKICVLVHSCKDEKLSWLPLTQDSKGISCTVKSLYMKDEDMEVYKQVNQIPRNIKLGHLIFIDPVWERKAYGKDGLWSDVVDALKRVQSIREEYMQSIKEEATAAAAKKKKESSSSTQTRK